MKALDLLITLRDDYIHGELDSDVNEAIKELEELENKDRLAELEKAILDYYLDKGYEIGIGNWRFYVEINSHYKSKSIQVYFYINNNIKKDSHVLGSETNTKEMFDKAFEYFSIKDTNAK